MRLESEGSTSREIKSLQTRTKNHKTQEEKHARLKFPSGFTCARARNVGGLGCAPRVAVDFIRPPNAALHDLLDRLHIVARRVERRQARQHLIENIS